ncbi:c-type cytochrome [Sphingomonas faeni]|jgi:cytochrome c|uniref:c-type cytochrome n=1 Tax=Sphingomonas faeni TaxID=185950 RepID=UPI0020C75F86|nr:c-type cytochrome [Sphingomonas faeni]MCP8893196.1 c-type cytochrome [Sphingomonas faeni]
MSRTHDESKRLSLLLLCGVATFAATPIAAQMAIPKAAPASGDKVFGQQCGACHSVKPGERRIGPSLAAVVGRKAGTAAGFPYSPALKASGITWNKATLDSWLTKSQAAVPGTRMSYAQADPAKRKAIIDYLTTLK